MNEVAQLLREANRKIQTANEFPDAPDYIKKCDRVEEEFKQKIANILAKHNIL